MDEAQRKGAFQLKPVWQRAAVVAAGEMDEGTPPELAASVLAGVKLGSP